MATAEKLPTFRQVINGEFEARYKRNSRYSLRAFARDLGLSPSRLSEVLNGGQVLSLESAGRIATKLRYDSRRAGFFCDLVRLEVSPSPDRPKIKARLKTYLKTADSLENLVPDTFAVIYSWQHFAILELMTIEDFVCTAASVAARLDIDDHLARLSLERLLRVGLIEEKNGRLQSVNEHHFFAPAVPSAALRSYHRQLIGKALQAIDQQTIEERDLNSVFYAIERSAVGAFKKHIQNFLDEMGTHARVSFPKEELYCLTMQFFRVDKKQDPSERRGSLEAGESTVFPQNEHC